MHMAAATVLRSFFFQINRGEIQLEACGDDQDHSHLVLVGFGLVCLCASPENIPPSQAKSFDVYAVKH
jgi:hypothetical protein